MTLTKMSDEELLQIATPIMDNLMDGATEKNWVKHTKDFTDDVRANFSEQELIRRCNKYQASHGNFGEREFMGLVRHPIYVTFYWKQRMTKVDGEYLALLSLIEVEGVIRVIRCNVELWEPSVNTSTKHRRSIAAMLQSLIATVKR